MTGDPLRAPIVVCELGKLYNRSSVIEFLLGEGVFVYNRDELKKNGFGHLKSIKNVVELQLTSNTSGDSKKATSNTETTTQTPGRFVCPVTHLETNGMHQFCALKTCGHVFSEKALNLFQELAACWTCNVPYKKEDIISINGSEKVVAGMEEKLQERLGREQEKKDKKRKKREGKKQAAIEPSKKVHFATTSTTTSTTFTSTTTTATATTDTLGPEVTCAPGPSYEPESDDASLGPMLGPMLGPFQRSAPLTSADRKRIRV